MTNYRTDLMDEILTSPEARNIVGQVSPIYGAAFVGLWLFQVIGCQLDDMEAWSRAFQAETVPQTATWSLDYWEENYGIPRNPNMTASQRRARIISRIRDRAPMSPAKLARYITDVSGYECEIIENTGKNRFTLIRRDQSGPLGLVRLALNEAKPAHVIYKLNMAKRSCDAGSRRGYAPRSGAASDAPGGISGPGQDKRPGMEDARKRRGGRHMAHADTRRGKRRFRKNPAGPEGADRRTGGGASRPEGGGPPGIRRGGRHYLKQGLCF